MTMLQTYRIRGDWMTNGYINNLNRRRWIGIEVIAGRAYLAEDEGGSENPLKMDVAGGISAWGASVSFLPDEGEINRLTALGVSIPEEG